MTPVDEARRSRNQQNARHSTGPKSHAGKARASLNATRHGLASAQATGRSAVFGSEKSCEGDGAYALFAECERQAHRELEEIAELLSTPLLSGEVHQPTLAAISDALANLERLQRYRTPGLIRWLKRCSVGDETIQALQPDLRTAPSH